MSLTTRLLEHPLVYRLWQAPFAEQKFAPVLAHNDLRSVRRVLDVACGPGTNTAHFSHTDYLGIDMNERYIQDACARHRRNFLFADVCTYRASPGERFDFILVNSFLHHLPDPDVNSILSHLGTLLTEDGYIHILELVMPQEASLVRSLARLDRGKYARSLEKWTQIFTRLFAPVVVEPYPLVGFGATLWNMIYFKGKALSSSQPSQSAASSAH